MLFFPEFIHYGHSSNAGEESLEKKHAGVRMQDLDVEQKEVGVSGMQKSVQVSCRGLRFALR